MKETTKGPAGRRHRTEEPSPKREVMGWLLLSMLYAPDFQSMLESALARIGGISGGATEKLEALGCKRSALINAAVLGSLARKLYPPIGAEQLRELAKKIRSTVWAMKQMIPPVVVPQGQILKDGSLEFELEPAGGDMQLEPWIEERLLLKATIFEQLSAMCKAKDVPSRAEFGRVGHIWPLVYVEAKTGEPRYALVARLLQETNVDGGMTGRRLREAYVAVKDNYPETLRWLRLATANLEALQTDGKIVIFAYAERQKEPIENANAEGGIASENI